MVALVYSVATIKVWQGSMSTIALVKKGKSTSHRTKHVVVRYFCDKGDIEVEYRPTLQMLADIILSKEGFLG